MKISKGTEKNALRFVGIINSAGISNTQTRRKLIQILAKSLEPLTVFQVAEKFNSKSKPNLTTLYRSLGEFEKQGWVSRVDFGDRVDRFEWIGPQKKKDLAHHHHIRCRECQKLQCLALCIPKSLIKRVEKMGFKNVQHNLLFLGLCKKCQ